MANERGTVAKYRHQAGAGIATGAEIVYLAEQPDGTIGVSTDEADATHMYVLLPDGTVGLAPYVEGHSRLVAIGERVLLVRVGAIGTLAADPLVVGIDAIEDNDPPAGELVDVTGSGLAVTDLSAVVEYTSGAGWLTATLDALTTPAVLTLAADTTGLEPGTYEATVTLESAYAWPHPEIAVTLEVLAAVATLGALTFSRTSAATYLFEENPLPLGSLTFSRASTATYTEDV